MTENKRFVNKGKDIFQYGEWWCSANGEHCADVIAISLNMLFDENKRLKQFQKQVASVIESKMEDNVCNDYKMEVLKEIWEELELDEVWFL